ncbi:MAG: sugar phosphate nucleotidyltransferase [Candidatus Woesearchaeota archaeon]
MAMKRIIGIVLAAGRGTRMYPFSDTIPKVMIPFWGKPLLAYHVEEFLDAKINDIVLICSNDNIGMIKDYFYTNYPAANIAYAIQESPQGPSSAIESASKYIINSMGLIKFGDNITSISLTKALLENYNGYSNGIITLREVENPSDYGIAVIEDDSIVELVEKPDNPPTKLASMGGFLLDSDILLSAIREYGYYSTRNGVKVEMPLPQFFLMQGLKLGYAILNEPVLDVGRPFDIIIANKLFSDNNGSSVSYIGDDARIGKNCVIKGACSIEGTLGDDCIIEDSYIMKGSCIGKGTLISRSVIGENVSIGDNASLVSGMSTVIIKGKPVKPNMPIGSFIGSNAVIRDNAVVNPGIIISPGSRM